MRARYPLRGSKVWNSACEVNVVEHCNLACRSCSHLSPIIARTVIEPGDLFRDLQLLSRSYHAFTLKLLGGEPLLHPDLPGVAAAVRRSGVADRVQVVTNGVLLPRMQHDFWASVDDVQVSVYPGSELPAEALVEVRGRAREHRVRLRFRSFSHFREAFATRASTDAPLVKRIFESCKIAHDWRCHTVADGYFYKCPKAYFIAKVLGPGASAGSVADGIEISDKPSFQQELRAYLESSEPLQACYRCLGTAGRAFGHEQVKRADWLPLQERSLEELVDMTALAADERRMRLPRVVRKVAERAAGVV